jgi:hypothetical protein
MDPKVFQRQLSSDRKLKRKKSREVEDDESNRSVDREHIDENVQNRPFSLGSWTQQMKLWSAKVLQRSLLIICTLAVIYIFYSLKASLLDTSSCSQVSGVWSSNANKAYKFPLRYKIKEKRYLVWTPFQSFEMIDASNNWLGEFSESVQSWIHELFGAAYVSLYDYKGNFNSYFKFDMMPLIGGRNAYAWDNQDRNLMTGKMESIWYSIFHGRRRPFVIRACNGDQFSSLKTHLIQFHQKWEISDEDGNTAAVMQEYMVTDYWGMFLYIFVVTMHCI